MPKVIEQLYNFQFYFLNSSGDKIEENVLHLYLKLCLSAPVDSQSCVFDDKFSLLKSLCTSNHFNPVNISSHVWNLFTFGTRCRHTKNKWITQVLQILISCKPLFLSYALKLWNCKSFYRLEIGSSTWCVKLPQCQLINWLIVSIY